VLKRYCRFIGIPLCEIKCLPEPPIHVMDYDDVAPLSEETIRSKDQLTCTRFLAPPFVI